LTSKSFITSGTALFGQFVGECMRKVQHCNTDIT